MDTGRHNPSCETARGHRCLCTQCGGSQHGVQGWLDHVDHDYLIRHGRRERFESKLAWTEHRPRRLEQTRGNQEITTDLARVDIADWLAAPSPPAGPEGGEPYPTPAEQVTALAEEMTRGAWREIVTELDRATQDTTSVKRDLTNHFWCDLFIGLVQAIEMTRRGFDSIPNKVKALILGSARQADRPHVTEAVVGLIVDKAWHGIQAAAFAGAPLLDLISNEEALRALRILAVFICPAPAQHAAVRHHALKALGEDATSTLTDQTKTRLAELFTDWRSASDVPPSG
ncbi:hypothetical protein DDE19_29725 [Micromonospora ureilytica]|uniref:Uncharacterized protein n=1 Tax=Micromonospora ureilytica TaxID=709868 RepID=A0A3N9XWL8_9ACTN|nr:hypothetical protein [Micromonospora ureilytica]RQX11943.1 hypothetical protein DDE19_29725 [Micromonospora ureilytica]